MAGMIPTVWDTLAEGYDFEFTRQWIQDTCPYARNPPRDVPLIGGSHVAPFYNWRFWGNVNVSPF